MMTVKVGEVINQLRNITAFGIVLCAIWILASFNIEGSRRQRLLIQDYLAYLVLEDGIRKATSDSLIPDGLLDDLKPNSLVYGLPVRESPTVAMRNARGRCREADRRYAPAYRPKRADR
jgi:hypothetical protein